MSKIDIARECVNAATQCSDHPCHAPPESEWKTVHYADSWCACRTPEPCNSYCDTYSTAVVELFDGSVFVADESSDSSGHG